MPVMFMFFFKHAFSTVKIEVSLYACAMYDLSVEEGVVDVTYSPPQLLKIRPVVQTFSTVKVA